MFFVTGIEAEIRATSDFALALTFPSLWTPQDKFCDGGGLTESDFSGPLGRKLDHVPTMSFVTGIQADILATSELRWGNSAPAGGVHRMALAPPRMPVLHFAPGIHHYAHFCGS